MPESYRNRYASGRTLSEIQHHYMPVFRMNHTNKIFGICLITVILALLLLNCWGTKEYFFHNRTTVKLYDFTKEYPFEPAKDTNKTTAGISYKFPYEKWSLILKEFGDRMWSNTALAGVSYKISNYIDVHLSLMGYNQNVVQLKNGYLARIYPEKFSQTYLSNRKHNILNLKETAVSQNCKFIFIQPAKKATANDENLPYWATNYYDEMADRLCDTLRKNGVEVIDSRVVLKDLSNGYYSAFYKTDHHWNLNAGLCIAQYISNYLHDKYSYATNSSCLAEEMFERHSFQNYMFASEGHDVSMFRSTPENFDILYPKFKNNFHVVIPDMQIDTIGTFNDVFINNELLHLEGNSSGYVYESIIYGNRPLLQIENINNLQGPRILLIKDSYGLALAPYLAICSTSLDLIDNRPSLGNFNGSISTYIRITTPDIVMLLTSFDDCPYK